MSLQSRELAARAGITYRALDNWTRLGHVVAEPRKAEVQGYHRQYSDDEVEVCLMIALLVRAGLTLTKAAEVGRGMVTSRLLVAGLTDGVMLAVGAELTVNLPLPPNQLIDNALTS